MKRTTPFAAIAFAAILGLGLPPADAQQGEQMGNEKGSEMGMDHEKMGSDKKHQMMECDMDHDKMGSEKHHEMMGCDKDQGTSEKHHEKPGSGQ